MASRYTLPIGFGTPPGTKWKGQHHACLVHHRSIPRIWRFDRRSRLEGRRCGGRDRARPIHRHRAARRHERLLATRLDVTSETEAHEAAGQAVKKFGRIDILVNNAGYGLLGAIEEASAAETQKLFGTNVFGLLGVTRAVLPHMRRQRSGHIINISSVGGYTGYPGWGVYGATKFAVEGISEALAGEVAPLGIKVTVVEPGFFRTDFLDDILAGRAPRRHRRLSRERRQDPRARRRIQPRPARRSAQAGAGLHGAGRMPRTRRCACRWAATRWSGSRRRTPSSQGNWRDGGRSRPRPTSPMTALERRQKKPGSGCGQAGLSCVRPRLRGCALTGKGGEPPARAGNFLRCDGISLSKRTSFQSSG